MVRVIFFDAAGTLIDTIEPAGFIYAQVARKYGLDVSGQEMSNSFRRAFSSAPGLAFGPQYSPELLRRLEKEWWRQVVAQTLLPFGPFENFDAYFEELFEIFARPQTWPPLPHALEVLDQLKSRKELQLGLVSNFDARIYHILRAHGILDYFDSVTISSEAGFAKPDPRIFEIALRKHSATPNEAMHVGDSVTLDVKGAQAAGIRAVLLDRNGKRTIEEGAFARITSLRDLVDILN